jgi:hypothetical protein
MWARRLWWGEYSLPKAIWGFYVRDGIAILTVSLLLAMPLLLNDLRPVALRTESSASPLHFAELVKRKRCLLILS